MKTLGVQSQIQGWPEATEYRWRVCTVCPHTGKPNPLKRTFKRFQKWKLPSPHLTKPLSAQHNTCYSLTGPRHFTCLQATESMNRNEQPAFKLQPGGKEKKDSLQISKSKRDIGWFTPARIKWKTTRHGISKHRLLERQESNSRYQRQRTQTKRKHNSVRERFPPKDLWAIELNKNMSSIYQEPKGNI